METNQPQSLMEAVTYFADPDVTFNYMKSIKWPDGKVVCPSCGGEHIGEIKSRRMFQCKNKECRKQFSVKVGTIFEDSPLSLQKWFVAVWFLANTKNGTSSCELARALDVTQKTAWFMLHRIRLAMQTKSFRKIQGEVEGDETFIGGRLHNMHKHKKAEVRKRWNGRGIVGKTVVQGLLERGGEVRAGVVANSRGKVLHKIIRENVETGTRLYTDALKSYRSLGDDFIHELVDHSVQYVRGRVHTNGLENFWSLLQRALGGTYVAVAPEHLDAYLDEQTMRFNQRKLTDPERFNNVMRNVLGLRMTYNQLIG